VPRSAEIRISRADAVRVGPWSNLFRYRCPKCQTIQPLRLISKLIPPKNKFDAHECHECSNVFVLKRVFGSGILFVFFFVFAIAPVFISASMIGSHLLSDVPSLSYFHESRGHREPNFLGFLLVVLVLVLPATWMAMQFVTRLINRTVSFQND
jgi:hypothetical protein